MPDATTQAEPLVRIYNKRAHSIIAGPHKAAPSAFSTVPRSIADAWMKQWPDGVVEASEAQKELNGANAELEVLRARVAELEKENAAIKSKSDKKGGKPAAGAELV